MLLHWYACISINTYCYIIYYISLEMVWWALSKASLIMQIRPVVQEILANKNFIVTDDLISRLFVVTFVHTADVQIALIWGFPAQLSLWKLVHWLWRYKLNEVCDSSIDVYRCQDQEWWTCSFSILVSYLISFLFFTWTFFIFFLSFSLFLILNLEGTRWHKKVWWLSHKLQMSQSQQCLVM